jgi:hypothetical protein
MKRNEIRIFLMAAFEGEREMRFLGWGLIGSSEDVPGGYQILRCDERRSRDGFVQVGNDWERGR